MNKPATTVVPNSHPAYVAEPITDNEKVVDVHLEPIVAWRVECSFGSSSASPVTVDVGLANKYAIYYSDTERWAIPDNTSGKGLGKLLEYFKTGS